MYNINRFDLQECGDFTWRVSDCEELAGLLTGDDGVGFFKECYCFFPFIHLILMFPFLSNNERFHRLFPLNSPTHFVPSVEIMVP